MEIMKNSIKRFGSKRYIPVMIPNKTGPFSFPTNWKKDNPPYIRSFDELNTIYRDVRFNGVGMVLDDLVCIDIDIKHNPDGTVRKNGFHLFKEWYEEYDLPLSDWYWEETRGGGAHYYFINDIPGFKPTNKFSDQGIDILTGEGHLTIIAGSHLYEAMNDVEIGKLSELPADFLGMVEVKKEIRKPPKQSLDSDLVSFEEAVKVLSHFPKDYWDTNNKWSEHLLCLRDTFDFDTALKIADRFMNAEEREVRTGGKTKVANAQILRRPSSGHSNPLTWGGMRNEATDYGYIDPEVELKLGFLDKKETKDSLYHTNKGPIPIPPGFAGDLCLEFAKNSKCTNNQAVWLVSQLLPALLYAGKFYVKDRPVSIYMFQISLAGIGKSYQISCLEREIKKLKHIDFEGFEKEALSNSKIKQTVSEKRIASFLYDEVMNLLGKPIEQTPVPAMLSYYGAYKGQTIKGSEAVKKDFNSEDVESPAVNIVGNTTNVNWDRQKKCDAFGSGLSRRVDLVWVGKVQLSGDDYMNFYDFMTDDKFSIKSINKLNSVNGFLSSLLKGDGFGDIEIQRPAMEVFAKRIQEINENKRPNEVELIQHEKILLTAARVALLNADRSSHGVAITKEIAEWSVRFSKWNVKAHTELMENMTDPISPLIEKALEILGNSRMPMGRLLRKVAPGDPKERYSIRQELKNSLQEDDRFDILKVQGGLQVCKFIGNKKRR